LVPTLLHQFPHIVHELRRLTFRGARGPYATYDIKYDGSVKSSMCKREFAGVYLLDSQTRVGEVSNRDEMNTHTSSIVIAKAYTSLAFVRREMDSS
jgi:hypothetical protein